MIGLVSNTKKEKKKRKNVFGMTASSLRVLASTFTMLFSKIYSIKNFHIYHPAMLTIVIILYIICLIMIF